MTKVLVTGGAGFIGSHLVDLLLQQGYEVRVLDDLSTGKIINLPIDHPALEFVQGSVAGPAVREVCRGVDAVVHLAAIVSVPFSIDQPYKSSMVNLTGFLNLLNCLREQSFKGRLVYASSSAVYGMKVAGKPLVEEDAPGVLGSPYAADKYADEMYAGLYADLYGLSALGFRFFNVYGPRQDPESPYSGVISIFMDRVSRLEPVVIYGDGAQTRDFVYVGDVVHILARSLQLTCDGVLNLGTGSSVSILELAEAVSKIFDQKVLIELKPERLGDVRFSSADISWLQKATDTLPETDLEAGLVLLKAFDEQ